MGTRRNLCIPGQRVTDWVPARGELECGKKVMGEFLEQSQHFLKIYFGVGWEFGAAISKIHLRNILRFRTLAHP